MLPFSLYSAAQTRELDRIAIEDYACNNLMEKAGFDAFSLLQNLWPDVNRITVLCGIGNNGGDGFVLARLAHQAGIQVQVLQIGDPAKIKDDALSARQACEQAGLKLASWNKSVEILGEIIVDGLLGTGLNSTVKGDFSQAIEQINMLQRPVLALDIPSGLHADTGQALGVAVKATHSISFIGLKKGMYTGQARNYCGDIVYSDLEVPSAVFEKVQSSVSRIQDQNLKKQLGKRAASSHKGHNGKLLIVGGDQSMLGAVCMAGEAALRTGAGMVKVATHSCHAPLVSALRPEIMSHGIEKGTELAPMIQWADVILLGPGLGRTDWSQDLFKTVMDTKLPMLVDADGLNLLSKKISQRDTWILTPHPGEAGRLLQLSTQEIEEDRFQAIEALCAKYHGTVVLKGAGTLIRQDTNTQVCDVGNPSQATAGMGDVLSGIIAGLMAQGMPLKSAAAFGVYVHAKAADMMANGKTRGLIATDLFDQIVHVIN